MENGSSAQTAGVGPPYLSCAIPARTFPATDRVASIGLEITRLEMGPRLRPLPSHRHDYFQIVLVTRGQGLNIIDWNVHPVRAGVVFALAPAQVHFWRFRPTTLDDGQIPLPGWPITGYALNFDAAFVASCASHETEKVLLPGLFERGETSAMYVGTEQLPMLVQTFKELEREYQRHEVGRMSALQAHFQLLLVQLNRARPSERPANGAAHADCLARNFRALIERHFRERLAVQDYATRLNVSEGHLCRIIRRQTGMTASDLIEQHFIVEAKRLLVHLDANIADIASSLGYDDPAYFARVFKKCTAQTPSEFRSIFDGRLEMHA